MLHFVQHDKKNDQFKLEKVSDWVAALPYITKYLAPPLCLLGEDKNGGGVF